MNDTKKVQKAIEKYRCVHCNHRATRRRRREGTKLDIPLCESMGCLRHEWAVEDTMKVAKEIAKKLGTYEESQRGSVSS